MGVNLAASRKAVRSSAVVSRVTPMTSDLDIFDFDTFSELGGGDSLTVFPAVIAGRRM